MKKVWQTRFGGIGSSDEEKGDCWRACVASILELPLEDAWDGPAGSNGWYSAFNQWLARYGLGCVCVKATPDAGITRLLGYHILETKSKTPGDGGTHAVVVKNGEVVHDPNPENRDRLPDYECVAVHIFVPLNPAFRLKQTNDVCSECLAHTEMPDCPLAAYEQFECDRRRYGLGGG